MKKLFIDFDMCLKCSNCDVKCSYFLHPKNNGITSLREEIAFLFACRRCENHPCINVCPTSALKRENGINKRSRFLCISCKSCMLACPFGTIISDIIPYITGKCDLCIGRLKEGEIPLCVITSKCGAIKFIEEEEIEEKEDLYKIGENLIVKCFNYLEKYGLKK
ncbi:MAG: 4Fe-4S binding protein [Candidatus Omnitrophica bacterium]|nr:4Fe-4S binding protein [Candidatus Omnitrophota bacterium]MCM8807780.1 4Fe-4S binding protein [Candidatus Omnitrophota bacterium]